jgi:hypothetical protein
MDMPDVQAIVERVELLLAGEELSERVESAVRQLLNVVEALSSDNKSLADEVERLKKLLDQKKKDKTTGKGGDPNDPNQKPKTNHSSEDRRKKLKDAQGKDKKPGDQDRRSFKDLPIHQTIECPVDPGTLPPDAVRLSDETVVVQDIEIQLKNIQFQRQVFYSAALKKYFRGPLPSGYDRGDFGAKLRALIICLKYCGNMSEPKIGEFLANFDVQVSRGSISNILTATAKDFEPDYQDMFQAGLSSTSYQQTDDTSARVQGKFWHTHILCNRFYTFYATRPRKDRLAVLSVLQNVPNADDLRFRLGQETLALLQAEFSDVPKIWEKKLIDLGEVELDATQLKTMLDDWFGAGNQQLRTAIEQMAAIVYYRHQTAVPIVRTLLCDNAGQFKLLTSKLALCWIHEGRHYEKLTPVVPRHQEALAAFQDRFWTYYAALREYRAAPTEVWAAKLRAEFDELFATRTGYEALDDRIAKTQAKRDELLTVLDEPAVPLHNNDSELGARVSARRRDVSLHSRSERGVRAMDIFTTLVQTTKKLARSAYAYIRDRLTGVLPSPTLGQAILQTAASG